MRIIHVLIIAFLFLYNSTFSREIEEPDHFKQKAAKLTSIVELEGMLSIFEKINDKWIGAYNNISDDELNFFECDANLNITKLSKLKINSDENILSYKISGSNILLIFGAHDDGYYAKSILFDYLKGSVLNSQIIYALVSEKQFDMDSWNEDLDYKVTDNKSNVLVKESKKNDINFNTLKLMKCVENPKTGFSLIYNFLESADENLDVYYSVISADGSLVKSERKTLIEKAYDKYRNPYGFYAELTDDNIPLFFVDYGDKKERFISSFALKDNELITASTNYPVEINGETDHYIKSARNDGNPLSVWSLICEDVDDFSKTFGLLKINISDDFKTLNNNIKVWNENEIEKWTDGNDLTSNIISDLVITDDGYYIILESNYSYTIYEQNIYIPLNKEKEILVMKLNNSLETIWTNYIKDRDIKKVLSCDNNSLLFLESNLRYCLKFEIPLQNDRISFFYHDLQNDEVFAKRVLSKSNGEVISDRQLFEADKNVIIYPQRIFQAETQSLMYLYDDCDSYILKFN